MLSKYCITQNTIQNNKYFILEELFKLPLNTQDIPFAQIYRIQLYKLRGNCLQSDCIPLTLECIPVQPTTLGVLQRMHKHRHINQTPCYPLPDPWNSLTVGSSPVLPPSHQSSWYLLHPIFFIYYVILCICRFHKWE